MSYPTTDCDLSTYLDSVLMIYNTDILPDLDIVRNQITNDLECFFKSLVSGSSFESKELFYSNSAYSGEYFSFSTRLKDVSSLREKLVRNDEILILKERFPIINDSVIEIKDYLLKFDDLIGIKIIGELEKDVDIIINILHEYQDYFGTEFGIHFLSSNTSKRVRMQNGIDIYKVKCKYSRVNPSESYSFELQAKSKFMSAWGDMEHQMFYKDRLSHVVKDSSQEVMNKVGNMIMSIDELLYSIRTSKNTYDTNHELTSYVISIQKIFGEYIRNRLTSNIDISLILIGTVLKKMNIDIEELSDMETFQRSLSKFESLCMNFEEVGDSSEKMVSFLKARSKSFKLQALFNIYSIFYLYDKSNQNINKEEIFASFIDKYCHTLLEQMNLEQIDADFIKLNFIMNSVLTRTQNQDAWLLSDRYKQVASLFSRCIQEMKAVYELDDLKTNPLGLEEDLMPDLDLMFDSIDSPLNIEEEVSKLNNVLVLITLSILDGNAINELDCDSDTIYKDVFLNKEQSLLLIKRIKRRIKDEIETTNTDSDDQTDENDNFIIEKLKNLEVYLNSSQLGREEQ